MYASKIKDDIENHIKNPTQYFDNLFHGRSRSYSKEGIYESLKQCFYFPYHKQIKKSDTIENIIKFYEKNNEIKFDNGKLNTNSNKKINWHQTELKTWYKPLPIICMFEAVLTYSEVLMQIEGFHKTGMKNGLSIWFRKGILDRTKLVLFVHAGSGGLLLQSEFIKKLPKECSVVIPELPGISFAGRVSVPPTVRELAKTITKFIKNREIKQVQMISHSFGGNILSCIINNQHTYFKKYGMAITNTILVEPIIFIPTLPFIHKFSNTDITVSDVVNQIKSNHGRLVSYVLLFRDIYTQFYGQRCFTINDALIGETEYEKNNIINIVFSENDELSPIHECVHYLESKKYNGNVKVFENRKHGDFCFDLEMQNYVIGLIRK